MMDWFYEVSRSIPAQAILLLEQAEATLADDDKLVERAIEGLALGLLFILVVKLRKPKALREDGWFHLSPGLLAKFVFFGSLLIALTAFIGLIIGLKESYRPSWNLQGMMEFSPVILLIAGFGVAAVAAYRAFFKPDIRWNHTYLERIVHREKVQIAWEDVEEVIENKEKGYFLVVSGRKRIRVWTHLNGVPQLIAALAGQEEALGLLQRQVPLTTSWKGALPSDQIQTPR